MNLIRYLRNAVYPDTGTPVIAFFGDSVTHGAFECIQGDTAGCNFDFEAVYHARLKRMLLTVNPWLPVSIINAGVAGDRAPTAIARLERDVIAHKPHICVVNFCLNDLSETVEEYTSALREILTRLKDGGIAPVLLTPSMLNSYVHPDTIPMYRDYAAVTAALTLTYLIYNRGLSRRGVTIEMLPDTMSQSEKEEFIADAERRMKRSKWMLAILVPFLFTFLFDAVELFLLDGILELIG